MNVIQLPAAAIDAAIEPLRPVAVRPNQAHRLIGVGRTKFFDLIARGEIASFKDGGVRLIEVAELDRYVARKRGGTPAAVVGDGEDE